MLQDNNLSDLNDAQKQQVLMQWEKHQHDDFAEDFLVTPFGDVLEHFVVKKGVWNPFIVSARHHAGYMFYHSHLFKDKVAFDIGCGTGIIGIVMAKYGAKDVLMGDISPVAVQNSKDNVAQYSLDNARVVISNLFKNIIGKADCITFMQPYFLGNPPAGDTISASMLAPQELIREFLKTAPQYLNPNGVIVMPSFSLAGDANNPAVIGPEYGYTVRTPFIAKSTTGLQTGFIAMHELTLD